VDRLRLPAAKPGRVTLHVPGDKSISHRAFLLAAIARGSTRIAGANRGADVLATIRALRALGVRIARHAQDFIVEGAPRLRAPAHPIDCGNSGTTMRLLAGLLAGRVNAVLDGDASLRRRPMERVTRPLNRMGAQIRCSRGGHAPLRICGAGPLHGAKIALEVQSAQVASAVMLAALGARGATTIAPVRSLRDHTQRMLRSFGVRVTQRGAAISVTPTQLVSPREIVIPGDLSSAVFFVCAAAVVPGARIRLARIGVNPTRTAILDVLRAMGVRLEIHPVRSSGPEPAADLIVAGGAPLRNVRVPNAIVPEIIDEIPALCALSATASGVLRLRGARELRHKESDRVATVVGLLQAFGADARALADGIVVTGGKPLRAPDRVPTHGDHRIGMAAAILAAAARAPLTIDESGCIATSFPEFSLAWRAAFSRRGGGR
jgi:3-phosphoshikimate 1-carboxyvinyltransferase